MYIVTHDVPKGLGRPSEWLDPRFGRQNRSAGGDVAKDWEKKIHATAVSKYVFKLGRLTVHPAVILDASGLLPERPGGWAVDDTTPAEDLPSCDLFSQPEGTRSGTGAGWSSAGGRGWNTRRSSTPWTSFRSCSTAAEDRLSGGSAPVKNGLGQMVQTHHGHFEAHPFQY